MVTSSQDTSSTVERWQSLPIIPLRHVAGREQTPIQDCGERLVPLSRIRPARLRVRPEYYLKGHISALVECFARRDVAVRLLEAAARLPSGLRIVVLDAWRPFSVQRTIYESERERVRAAGPTLDEAEIDRRTQLYVALPSERSDRPSPHLTGGAIDLTIEDEKGVLLDMGTAFDHFGPEAHTRYFEEQIIAGNSLSPQDEVRLGNRRLLFHAMSAAGFTNYLEEWWHFDYGNQFWATIKDTVAIYGPAYYEFDVD